MKRTSLAVFGACAVVGAVVGTALPAAAWSVRQNGSFCMTDPGANVMHDGAGVSNYNTAAIGRLTCPVTDTSLTPKTGITAFSAIVNDQSAAAGISALACIQFASLAGGACGATVTTSAAGTGLTTLSPPRTLWGPGNANDMPYLLILLPARASTTTTPSYLLGYSFSG
jgi:hypothetical protein